MQPINREKNHINSLVTETCHLSHLYRATSALVHVHDADFCFIFVFFSLAPRLPILYLLRNYAMDLESCLSYFVQHFLVPGRGRVLRWCCLPYCWKQKTRPLSLHPDPDGHVRPSLLWWCVWAILWLESVSISWTWFCVHLLDLLQLTTSISSPLPALKFCMLAFLKFSFIYLCLAVLGLFVAASRLSPVVCRLLIAVASLVAERALGHEGFRSGGTWA